MFYGAVCKAVLTAGWPGVLGTAWGSEGSMSLAAGQEGGQWAGLGAALTGRGVHVALQLFSPCPARSSWLSRHAFALTFASLHVWHLYFSLSDVTCNYSETCPLALLWPLSRSVRSWLPDSSDSLPLAAPEALIFFRLSQIQRSRKWGSGRMLLVLYPIQLHSLQPPETTSIPGANYFGSGKAPWTWRDVLERSCQAVCPPGPVQLPCQHTWLVKIW